MTCHQNAELSSILDLRVQDFPRKQKFQLLLNNDSLECHISKDFFSWGRRPQIATLPEGLSYTKIWPQICRVCLVLEHFWSNFVQTFVHVFVLYVERGGHSRVSDSWGPSFGLNLWPCLPTSDTRDKGWEAL